MMSDIRVGRSKMAKKRGTSLMDVSEQMHWFEATFRMFGRAVFEVLEVKRRLRLNLEPQKQVFQMFQKNPEINAFVPKIDERNEL